MQPEQSLLLGEERNLLKFTEQTAGELANSARSMWEDFTLPATPESARTAHGQPSPPAYIRNMAYKYVEKIRVIAESHPVPGEYHAVTS